MTILEETRELVREKIGREYGSLIVEKAVIGLFFTAVKLFCWVGGVEVTHPDKLLEIVSLGGSGYHFLDRYADRIVTLKRSMP
jgi:hypothetical protein